MLIYLVDDDEIFNTIHEVTIKRVLGDVEIKIFKSGTEVIESINNSTSLIKPPELLFLDIRMPDMDGFMLLEKLEKMELNPFFNTVIYMLSSTLDEKDLVKAKSSLLVKDFLSKPMGTERFMGIIANLEDRNSND